MRIYKVQDSNQQPPGFYILPTVLPAQSIFGWNCGVKLHFPCILHLCTNVIHGFFTNFFVPRKEETKNEPHTVYISSGQHIKG